jgi:hypothetical protein
MDLVRQVQGTTKPGAFYQRPEAKVRQRTVVLSQLETPRHLMDESFGGAARW